MKVCFARIYLPPLVVVIQNNNAISTPEKNQKSNKAETLAQKAVAFGIPGSS